jgi:hypothetical protein
MDRLKLKEQVEIIRQAFGYINRFKGETFVIKLESSLIAHPCSRSSSGTWCCSTGWASTWSWCRAPGTASTRC